MEAINAFEKLKNRFALNDIYWLKHPESMEYTWEVLNPSIIRERIDIIYISKSLNDYVIESGIIPVHKTCSDHGIPFVHIRGFDIANRGPGLWKLNNELLSDKNYVTEMNNKIDKWLIEAERDLPDKIGVQWCSS